MKNLSRSTIKLRDEISTLLRDTREELDEALITFNRLVNEQWEIIKPLLDEHNNAISDANSWLEETANSIQEFIDEKSDKWQWSERGEAYSSWKEVFSESFDTIDLDQPG